MTSAWAAAEVAPVKKVIASCVGESKEFERQVLAGELGCS
jgi:acyl CoA:acetate/3-ketoacid CoA transferase alpha subunit